VSLDRVWLVVLRFFALFVKFEITKTNNKFLETFGKTSGNILFPPWAISLPQKISCEITYSMLYIIKIFVKICKLLVLPNFA